MTAADLRVTALGHSGLLVEAGGERVLVDPLLRKGAFARGLLAVDPPRWLRLDRLPRPSVLVLTHAHSDHFDPPSLAKVERTIPVIVPPDSALVSALQGLGFKDVRALSPGGAMRLGGVLLGATPSIHRGGDEIGLLVSTARVSFWNIADTEVDTSVAQALLDSRPAIDVVAARFQPIRRVLDNWTRGAGASFDKADMLRWLEAASTVKPRAVFPYGAGIALRGRPSWLNRYMFPFSEEEIARLLSARLAPPGVAYTMNPGDVLEADPLEIRHRVQSSPFVGAAGPSRRPAWEPIDRATFGRLNGSDRKQLVARIEAILAGPFADWFRIELRRPGSVFSGFVEWGRRLAARDSLWWYSDRLCDRFQRTAVAARPRVQRARQLLLPLLRGRPASRALRQGRRGVAPQRGRRAFLREDPQSERRQAGRAADGRNGPPRAVAGSVPRVSSHARDH